MPRHFSNRNEKKALLPSVDEASIDDEPAIIDTVRRMVLQRRNEQRILALGTRLNDYDWYQVLASDYARGYSCLSGIENGDCCRARQGIHKCSVLFLYTSVFLYREDVNPSSRVVTCFIKNIGVISIWRKIYPNY